jgi:uncharacterized protein (TIGR02231 family)
MKKPALILSFILTVSLAFAGIEKNVNSKITDVIVYFDKALITRNADVTINTGITTLVFYNVSAQVVENTLQARSAGNFQIIDVKHDIKYLEPPVQKKTEMPRNIRLKIELMKDSLFMRKLELQKITSKKQSLEKEMDIIAKNKLFLGTGKSDTMPVLKEMMTFYRAKMDEIQEELYKIKLQEYKADKASMLAQQRLEELQNYNKVTEVPDQEEGPIHCILVTVASETGGPGSVTINYLVDGAGWEPGYDLRSANSKKSLTLTYKARVFQNTGESWDNVKMKLSTFANDAGQNAKPVMPEWVLAYFQNRIQNNLQLNMNIITNTSMPTLTGSTVPLGYQVATDDLSGFFNTVEFDVKTLSTVASDGEKVLMVLQNKSVPVDYSFYIAPKLNKNSFLIAKIPNQSDLDLLPSVSNIYVNDTYMGETSINTNEVNDTLEIAMGKDQEIVCTRKKIRDSEKSSILGKTKLRTITVEMVVKNNKQHDVDVVLEDQVPVSGDKTITVLLVDGNGAKHNMDSGSLLWDLGLKAKQSKKVTFTYTIEYSKDQKL